jgi:L-threonylcarbamoyladenylate synthase
MNNMQILPIENIDLDFLVQALKEGKTIVYPTETCYGLGADATNSTAVEKLFAIKKRQEGKSMLIVFPDIAMAQEYVQWSETIQKLADKFWPGALTIVAPATQENNLAPGVKGSDGTVAFRVSSYPLVHEITSLLGTPIVSTSANIAGEDNPYDPQEIVNRFANEALRPDILIDGRILPHTSPSTIVKIENDHLTVLRQGEVKVEI